MQAALAVALPVRTTKHWAEQVGPVVQALLPALAAAVAVAVGMAAPEVRAPMLLVPLALPEVERPVLPLPLPK